MSWTECLLDNAYVRRWDSGAGPGHEGGALVNGVGALMKRTPAEAPHAPST